MFSVLFSSGLYGLSYISEETKEIREFLFNYAESARSNIEMTRLAYHEEEMRGSQHSIYLSHGVLGDEYKRLHAMTVDMRRGSALFPPHLFPLGRDEGAHVYHNLIRIGRLIDNVHNEYSIKGE